MTTPASRAKTMYDKVSVTKPCRWVVCYLPCCSDNDCTLPLYLRFELEGLTKQPLVTPAAFLSTSVGWCDETIEDVLASNLYRCRSDMRVGTNMRSLTLVLSFLHRAHRHVGELHERSNDHGSNNRGRMGPIERSKDTV